MIEYKRFFANKRITVMGLGVLGRGVGDTKFLAECGAELTVTDLKKEEDLTESVQQLKQFSNITFVLGEHRLKDFQNRDLILKSAGVPLNSIHIAEAQKHNIPVEMSSALFSKIARQNGVTIVGITGTRGKSTVTHLLYQILKNNAQSNHRVFLGGNIKGVSTLPFLKDIHSGDIAVLELDSWQLQGFGTDKISPHISVFTTFLPDHMNYYKGDMDTYLSDKANIFRYQSNKDVLIVGEQEKQVIFEKFKNTITSEVRIISSADFPSKWQLRIPGDHNTYNAALAISAAQSFSIPDTLIRKTVEAFRGVEGRLELIREIDGVKIYNDTTSTMPDATIAGLKALSHKKNIILIMGGADKAIEMDPLIKALPLYVKQLVLLPGSGTDKIKDRLEKLSIQSTYTDNLLDAVQSSWAHAAEGDVILFSPAFASFGLFNNEYDRGEQFNMLVEKIKA